MTTIIGTMPLHLGTAGLITDEHLTQHTAAITVAPHQILIHGHEAHTFD